MRDPQNILAIGKLLPQYLGFIFYPESPRFVGDDFRMPAIDPSIKKVGVFVNASSETIGEKVKQYKLDAIQLHGQEAPEQCQEIRAHNVLVIKAFPVGDKLEYQHIKRYHNAADFFLFDTKGKYHGGNARRFDWNILRDYDQQTPFFLSGGLTAEHIDEAKTLKDMNIAAVDLNSGVESAPAVKDIEKVKQVISRLKN